MARARKRFAIGCLWAAAALAGCATTSPHDVPSAWLYPHAALPTVSETPDDHNYRVARILNVDQRLLANDLDLLFMTDRSTRLSRWQSR